jgi:geranylgeranyl pyrophosphate synthase
MTLSGEVLAQEKVRLAAMQPVGWLEAVQADLEHVTERMRAASFLDNELLDASVNMILAGGGKRMRPAVSLLVGRAARAPFEKALPVAASVELLHTATLVHDDLIDSAKERRGAPTLHTTLPLGVTVLTGDFLFAQSAALAAEADNVQVVKVFAQTLVNICKGEILQAQTRWHVPTMELYLERIYGKTAALFEAAAISGALLGKNIATEEAQAFGVYGRELGLAFQIVDDALDFVSTKEKLGKPAGHDLRQGIITLPVLYYLKHTGMGEAEFLKRIHDADALEETITAIRETGAARQAFEAAKEYVAKAEAALNQVEWEASIDHLIDLAQYAVARDF